MKVAVAAETEAGEPRVAATPETVKKLIGLGAEVAVEPGAGIKSGILDADYAAAGAAVNPAAAEGAEPYLQPDYSGGCVLVIGAEGRGLRPRVAAACDQLVALPLRGHVQSLNASAAAAALLYGILQKRNGA